jgi:hypothetical protein
MVETYVKIYRKLPPNFELEEYSEEWGGPPSRESLERMINLYKRSSTFRWIDSEAIERTVYDDKGNITVILEYHIKIWSEGENFKPGGNIKL